MPKHKWMFASRFRRNAFGWKSLVPTTRIKEAVSEIRQASRKMPVAAAEGAVLFLERLSPAIEQVDGSSGAIGTAVNKAIEALVLVIAEAQVTRDVRQGWLERLWEAIQQDDMPYIESLGDHWGELCGTQELATYWADQFIGVVKMMWGLEQGHGHFKGTTACLSSLFAAGRYEELLDLLEMARFKWWGDRYWGVKALVAMGKPRDALAYAEASKGLNAPLVSIAKMCEDILLSMGEHDGAYQHYAIEANQGATYLATFRAIVKKYPKKPTIEILQDLIASRSGEEGKWFAAAKDAGFYDLAIKLANTSPTDPRTLNRAAKEFADDRPQFAIAVGTASLRWMADGVGYEITGIDVLDAYSAIMQAASHAETDKEKIKAEIRALLSSPRAASEFIRKILHSELSK